MAPLKVFLAFASVLLSCVFSDTVNIDFDTAISKCSPDGWSLVDSKNVPVIENIRDNKVLKAGPFSCASFVLNVTPGDLELSVFLNVNENSRIEVLVRDNDASFIDYVYGKSNIDFEQGWHTITLSIDKETTAHVTLLGVSQYDDDVIVKSIKYNDYQNLKSSWTQKLGDVKIIDLISHKKKENQQQINNDIKEDLTTIKHISLLASFDDNEGDVSPTVENTGLGDEGITGGSTDALTTENTGPGEEGITGGSTDAPTAENTGPGEEGITGGSTDAPTAENTGPGEEGTTGGSTNAPTAENTGPGEEGITGESTDAITAENTGTSEEGVTGGTTDAPTSEATASGDGESATEGTTSETTNSGEGASVSDASTVDSTDSSTGGPVPGEVTTEGPTNAPSTEKNNSSFWNVWTVALVAVDSGCFVAMVVVGAYHLGRNSRGIRTTAIDLSDFEAPRIIPRAKTAMPPYQRFGGGGSDYGYGSQRDL